VSADRQEAVTLTEQLTEDALVVHLERLIADWAGRPWSPVVVARRLEEPRGAGSDHLIVRCGSWPTVIPVHSGDIPPGTLRAIERDLEPCLGARWLQQ
jgi:hypothetical protein